MKTWIVVVLALALGAGAVEAQTVEKRTLTLEGARKAIAGAQAYAAQVGAPGGVIAVVDDGGNLVALERLDGSFPAGARVSIGKARTAVLFKKPTRFFEELINKGRTAMTAVDDFTPLIGGVPILVDGQIAGGIGVSGAASAQQDEELAIAGAGAVASAPHPGITYLRGSTVAAAFAKGQPLVEVDNYKVHASHREGPGKVEVHVRDTDIIHVLHGWATLITGGSVIDGKTVEPDEIRGASIQGGESRKIAEGDVIVVPRGVPHWFEQVPGPLDYYVVKVR